ncbi:MAG TPA: FecR family protein [Candidatus Dormibacteraeota bacterium]|nr:FecR family protein [Candidatus Dormibacteraeota bacterium]
MASVAAKNPPKRRGGLRLLIVLLIVVLIVAGFLIWLNLAAKAAVNVPGSLIVYQPAASINSVDAKTGATVKAGDKISTNAKGRAAVTLPDGTMTRLATDTTITMDSAHFTKGGNLNDVSFKQQIGRTFTNVQHLVSGATFEVAGPHATASVRGTKFEVSIKSDGTMTVKVYEGTVTLRGAHGFVTINAGQQATANPDGTLTQVTAILPDPTDPFGPGILAADQVAIGTTPGTEQDFIGAPLHNGEQQQYSYSYAGGTLVKAALGYSGSSMKLTVKTPDGQTQSTAAPPPAVVTINNAPAGIYTIVVDGVTGLGTTGEEPFVAVASVESCTSADNEQNGAIHRGYTAMDLMQAVQGSGQGSGLSNLKLKINDNSVSGAIISGSGSYNGVSWSGDAVLTAHDGTFDITPVSGNMFGLSVPAQQVVQQIAQVIGQDPSNINPGFMVDRLFTCNSVLIVDGHMG